LTRFCGHFNFTTGWRDFEKRALRTGEPEQNLILHFNPHPAIEMQVACLWDRASETGSPDLYSLAVITDEPPPEVAATGHNRCIIPLNAGNVRDWLDPATTDKATLYQLLDDRERPTMRMNSPPEDHLPTACYGRPAVWARRAV
jgi:putative SOS response-associated peptidase YedK